MRGIATRVRTLAWVLLFWLGVSFVVWNGFFDILVTRGEKQYLLTQARHELGVGPKVTMDAVMRRTIHDAAVIASIWSALVLVSGIGTSLVLHRAGGRGACP